jgi:hypothetical protein
VNVKTYEPLSYHGVMIVMHLLQYLHLNQGIRIKPIARWLRTTSSRIQRVMDGEIPAPQWWVDPLIEFAAAFRPSKPSVPLRYLRSLATKWPDEQE